MNANDELVPHLFEGELELIEREMKRASRYLEFGTGGSTALAVRCGIKRIVSADSDEAWLRKTAKILAAESRRIEFIHCDIGPVGEWGTPLTNDRMRDWPHYFVRPWSVFLARNEVPDLIYIDARFRVACALYSILQLHLHRPGWLRRRATRIMIHDYLDRPQYHVVADYASMVASGNTLAIFEPKRDLSMAGLMKDLFSHQFDSG